MTRRPSKRELRQQELATTLGTGQYQRVSKELTGRNDDLWAPGKPGEHKWIVTSIYRLTYDQCLDAHRTNQQVPLTMDTLVQVVGPGCALCEQPWINVHNKPCSGDPDRQFIF